MSDPVTNEPPAAPVADSGDAEIQHSRQRSRVGVVEHMIRGEVAVDDGWLVFEAQLLCSLEEIAVPLALMCPQQGEHDRVGSLPKPMESFGRRGGLAGRYVCGRRLGEFPQEPRDVVEESTTTGAWEACDG